MYIPRINLRIDLEKETEMCTTFLHSEKFPHQREAIFRNYPDLKLKLEENDANEKEIVHSFLEDIHRNHEAVIQSIVADSERKIATHGAEVLENLSSLMDYTWTTELTEYLVVPTVLPFSPFRDNTIFFSIIRKLRKSSQKDDVNHDILPLLAHELSHVMLRDILAQGEKKGLFVSYGWTTKHFLQEILAPVLMNQESLKNILGIEDYLGNPYLRQLNVKIDSHSENVVAHFRNMYETMKFSEHKVFTEIITVMADELESAQSAFEEKLKMWGDFGHRIFSDADLLRKYADPILLA